MNHPLIDIKDLNFSYHNQSILININLAYHSSQFLGIIGQNGGGKSTLLKLILGLIPHHLPIKLNLPIEQVGYVPQHQNYNPHFPICIEEIVKMGRVKPYGRYTQEDKQETLKALETLQITHLRHQKFTQLSGGQRQKVLLARALCANPKLLILDEPTASIDSFSTDEIFALLQTLHSQGVGIIVVCHDLSLLLTHCTHIAYMHNTLTVFSLPQEKDKLISTFGCKHHIIGHCDDF